MKDNFFDKLIKEKAMDHQAAVPADAWDNIQKKKKKRRPIFFWWILPLLLVGFGIYEYGGKRKTKRDSENIVSKNNALNKDSNTLGNRQTANIVIDKNDSLHATVDIITKQQNTGTILQALNADSINKVDNKSKLEKEATANFTPKENNSIARANPGIVSKTKRFKNGVITTTESKAELAAVSKSKTKQIKIKRRSIVNSNKEDQISSTDNLPKNKKARAAGNRQITVTPAIPIEDSNKEELIADEPITKTEQQIKILPARSDSEIVTVKGIMEEKKTIIPVADELAKKTAQKIGQSKQLFIDISASPFVALQHNQKLSGIERTTLTTDNKTIFKTDRIYTRLDPSVAFTISLRKDLNKRLSFSAGLQYSKIKETIRLSGKETNTKYNYIKRLDPTGSSLIDDTVQVQTEGRRIIDAVNSFDFVTIPLAVQYKLYEKNKWSMMINGGIYLNIKSYYKNSIQGNLEKHYAANTTVANTNNKITMDIYAGLRLNRLLVKNIQLFAAPFFQFNFMRYNMHDMINNKNIYRAGINIGFAYALKY